MDERTIALSKTKLLMLVVGSVAFALLGIWITKSDSSTFDRSAGILCVAFSALCGFYGLWKLFDTDPGLILNSEGIVDNSSAAAAGFIPWNDVTGYSVYEMKRQKFIVVSIVDPQKYILTKSPLLRALARANNSMCGSPVAISSSSLKVDFAELQRLINIYVAKYVRSRS